MIKTFENFIKYKDLTLFHINDNYEYDNSGKYTKLINRDVIDRTDIDPYGEEIWENIDVIDWNRIKIIHPDKNDLGKNVLIIKNTRYYGHDLANPADVIGIINEFYSDDDLTFGVIWNDGSHNSYESNDLTIIELKYINSNDEENFNIDEGFKFIDNIKDYYKIFGPKFITDRLLFDDITNISKSNYKFKKSNILSIIKQVVDFYYDEKDIKFIGSGFYGSVYQTSDETKVLKITTDAKEVKKAERLRKINVPGVVDYYDVREINVYDSKERLRSYGLWSIILEKVYPLKEFEKSVWDSFEPYLKNEISSTTGNYKEYNKFYNNDGTIDNKLPYNVYNVIDKMTKLIDLLIESSKKHKIKFYDLHAGNLGKDIDANYKFFDIRSDVILDKKLPLKSIRVNI